MFKPGTLYILILLPALIYMKASWADDFPPWLSGKPDLRIIEERSKLYEWVFQQADKQTHGLASKESLARKRLINLSNKLAEYSRKTAEKEFSVELKYLVLETEQPTHFRFFITYETLQQLLQK